MTRKNQFTQPIQSSPQTPDIHPQDLQYTDQHLQKLLHLLEEPSPVDLAMQERIKKRLLREYDALYPSRSISANPSLLERWFFTRPWQVILPFSLCLSIVLHLVLAENFSRVVSIFLGLGAF